MWDQDSSQCKKDSCTLWFSPRSAGARRHRRCRWRAVWLTGCGRRGSPFPNLIVSRRVHITSCWLRAKDSPSVHRACDGSAGIIKKKNFRVKSEVFLTVSHVKQMLLQDSSVSHLLRTVLNIVQARLLVVFTMADCYNE